MREGFRYCLETPPGSSYPPIVEPMIIDTSMAPVAIDGRRRHDRFPADLQHHGDIHSLGFRIGDLAYCSDVSDFPPETIDKLRTGSTC